MTDLSAIFRPKAAILLPTMSYKNTIQSSPFMSLSRRQPIYNPQSYFKSAKPNTIDRQLNISSQAKKIITYDNLQQQASWFDQKNLLQCLIKISIVGGIIFGLYFNDKIQFNSFASWFVFSTLLLGLQHNIFGSGMFNKWVNLSLIGTALVLSNQIFLYTIVKIRTQSAVTLFYTHQSLIPSAYVTVLISIVFYSLALLSTPAPRSIIQILLTQPKNLLQLLLLVFKLKIAILQAYSIMLIITAVVQLILCSYDGYYDDFSNLFSNILHPSVLLAEIITFFTILLAMHIILRVISTSVSKIVIKIFYNTKNRDTKLPIILQLLRISPNDKVVGISNKKSKSAFQPIIKILNMSWILNNYQRAYSRSQIQNLYRHSLHWLKDLLIINSNALNTKISTSKFYHTYFDIFKEFSEGELNRCASCLFQLGRDIENLNMMRLRPKKFSQDIFFWPRIVKKQSQIWSKAVQCCKYLKIADLIMQILSISELDPQLWVQSQIGRNLNQIKQRTFELKDNSKLNPVIRQKLFQYYKKSERTLQK